MHAHIWHIANPVPVNQGLNILVLCYTNHALDQFCCDLLPLTTSLVRLGGGSKDERLCGHDIRAVAKASQSSRNLARSLWELGEQIQAHTRKLDMKACFVGNNVGEAFVPDRHQFVRVCYLSPSLTDSQHKLNAHSNSSVQTRSCTTTTRHICTCISVFLSVCL